MKKEISAAKALETLSIIALFCFLVSLIFKIELLNYIGIFFLVVGLFFGKLARAISILWLKFAEVLGVVNSFILLNLVFYVFLFPIAFIYRRFNKDPLMLKEDVTQKTFYTTRETIFSARDLEKPW